MASPVRHFDPALDEARLLDLVRALLAELGHQAALASVGPGARLDRDLGLGSLERVELLLRAEQTFAARLEERAFAEAETIEDLLRALSTATGAPPTQPLRDSALTSRPRLEATGLNEGCPAAETFQDVLRQRARANSAAAHLIFFQDEGEGQKLTFGDLFAGAERVASAMARRGIGRGDAVAIMLPTSPEFFLTFAGTLLAGATPVPVYPPFRADRIEEYAARQSAILANAGARLLVTFREAGRVARLLQPRVPSLEAVVSATSLAESAAAAPLGPPVHARSDDLALLQYTSGSTGNPKGVMLTHANLLANIRAIGEALAIRSDDVAVSWLPLYHDMGLIGAWLLPLYFGMPLVVLSPIAFLTRPLRWLQAVHRYRGSIAASPNFGYELATAKIADQDLDGLDLSSWRAALNGAEPVLPETLDRFAARFARCGFRREALLPVYGLAEASLAVTIPAPGIGPRVDRVERAAFEREGRAVPLPPDTPSDDSRAISFVSVGRPIPRHEVRIVKDRGEQAGERVEGQLWFRAASATSGYFRDGAASASLFPEGQAAGWIDSGDRAYQADGEIYITGRVKDIIIHAGRNLYPHEIESLVAQVAGVRKGCVVAFGAADPTTGTERLVVVAESRERDSTSRARLAQAITAHVAEALGIPPDVVEVVPPGTLPKTSSGKLQRDATKDRYLSGTLSSSVRPVWLQVARLAAASSAGRIRPALRRAGEVLYGCYALAVFGIWMGPAWILVSLAPSRKAAASITTAAVRVYLRLAGWRVRVAGRENLDDRAPRMFISNHTSYADLLVLIAALGFDARFVAKAEVGAMPFFRTFLRKAGHFSFHRDDPQARLAQVDEIEAALRGGESVFVFPEGTFTAQAGVRPFQLGAFKAAIAAGRPVQPVAVAGARRALRDGTWLPRPVPITITICPLIQPQGDASNWKEIVRVRDAAREVIAHHAGELLL